jgi:hypothetical protein
MTLGLVRSERLQLYYRIRKMQRIAERSSNLLVEMAGTYWILKEQESLSAIDLVAQRTSEK